MKHQQVVDTWWQLSHGHFIHQSNPKQTGHNFLLLRFSVSLTRGTVYDQLRRACSGGGVEVGAAADGARK